MRDIHRIVDRIDQILKNERNQPLDMLGSYIVGETIIQDDYREIQKNILFSRKSPNSAQI